MAATSVQFPVIVKRNNCVMWRYSTCLKALNKSLHADSFSHVCCLGWGVRFTSLETSSLMFQISACLKKGTHFCPSRNNNWLQIIDKAEILEELLPATVCYGQLSPQPCIQQWYTNNKSQQQLLYCQSAVKKKFFGHIKSLSILSWWVIATIKIILWSDHSATVLLVPKMC